MSFLELKLNECKNVLEKRERDARQAEQRKNDLVVYLAHDIRTPLTSVIGYLDLMNEAPELSAEQRAKYLSITLDKSYRLEQLINEFFEITRFMARWTRRASAPWAGPRPSREDGWRPPSP